MRREIARDGGDLNSKAESPNDVATPAGTPASSTRPEANVPPDATIWLPPDMPWDDLRGFNTNLIRLCTKYRVRIEAPHDDQQRERSR